MPIVNTTIPNLIGGISQQPDRLKLDGQCNDSLNCYATVAEGLKKRPYARFVANIGQQGYGETAFVHFINRNPVEQYVVLYDNSDGLKVFNLLTGVEATVNGAQTYLNTSGLDPDKAIKALTVADYTFFVNRTKTVNLGSTTTGALDTEVVVFVKQGDFQKDYTITIFGTDFTYTTGDNTNGSNADTNRIATELSNLINANVAYNSQADGNLVKFSRVDLLDPPVSVSDGLGGRGLELIYKAVDALNDLPTQCYNRHKVEVVGDADTNDDNYWVEFQLANGSAVDGEYGEGSWVEAVAPLTIVDLDEHTMPHTLISTGVDTFDFAPFTWDDRQTGDNNTNPAPSFVGNNLNDVFFFKNRLGFISSENVVMSESGNFSNFWRNTVTQLLDSTPIDVSVTHTDVAILRHAVTTSARLILFSDRNQFSLKGEELLTNATVSITPVTSFENDLNVSPTTVGRYTYFGFQRGQFTGVREYFLDNLVNDFDQNETTSHVPRLLPQNLKTITGTTSEDQIAFHPRGSSEFFLYSYYWSGREKIMSSWSRHDIKADMIVGMRFIDSNLYVITRVDGYLHIQYIPFEQGLSDGVIIEGGDFLGGVALSLFGLTDDVFNGLYSDMGNGFKGSPQYEQIGGDGVIRKKSTNNDYWEIVDSSNSNASVADSGSESTNPWEIIYWLEA